MTQAIRCVGLALGMIDSRSPNQELCFADAALLRALAPIIENRQGVIAEQPGAICALFRDVNAAVDCGSALFEKLDEFQANDPEPSVLSARVAIESGDVELEGHSLRGPLYEALQLMLVRAPSLSLVIGRNAALNLDVGWASRARPLVLGPVAALAPEELEVIGGAMEMPWRADASTHQEATVVADLADVDSSGLFNVLELIVAGVAREVLPADCPYSIGRDTRCNLVLSGGEASRLHATISYEQNRFYYTDSSRNGTYILTVSGEELFVHQERHWLVGRGAISAGTPVMNQNGELVRFICEPMRPGESRPIGAAIMRGLIPEPSTTIRR